ncbi:hypothetical protein EG329_002888 [Mollisiaceae sp. DMI_Dod_QoI]|nr:hypothetical protein EG329_002888 [Helotiales sp. DMI_Dod_QoI]
MKNLYIVSDGDLKKPKPGQVDANTKFCPTDVLIAREKDWDTRIRHVMENHSLKNGHGLLRQAITPNGLGVLQSIANVFNCSIDVGPGVQTEKWIEFGIRGIKKDIAGAKRAIENVGQHLYNHPQAHPHLTSVDHFSPNLMVNFYARPESESVPPPFMNLEEFYF